MAQTYPCRLPGVLVNSNGYEDQGLVSRNDLDSGAPVFRLRAESGWMLFDVAWSFNALETQVFRNWQRSTLTHGSKSFNIGLMIDGFNGTSNIVEHECYFNGTPSYTQRGMRWNVGATLLAIAQAGLDECDGESLVNAYNGFENLNSGIALLDQAIVFLEDNWN